MNALLTIVFAGIAAVGNALFALGQKQASNAGNGLLFVGASAGVACVLALLSSPFLGPVTVTTLIRSQGRPILLCGVGLFLTYLGFNLLYTRFGASAYIVYASMAIVTSATAPA